MPDGFVRRDGRMVPATQSGVAGPIGGVPPPPNPQWIPRPPRSNPVPPTVVAGGPRQGTDSAESLDYVLVNKMLWLQPGGVTNIGAEGIGNIVNGPVSSVPGNAVIWGNAAGNLLQDAGYPPAPLASPNFTGTPTAPMPPLLDSTNALATTAWVENLLQFRDAPADGSSYVRNTNQWVSFNGASVGSAPPSIAGNGSLWWDNTDGQLYVYYDDGNSKQWVITSSLNAIGGGYLPLGGGTLSGLLTGPYFQATGFGPYGAQGAYLMWNRVGDGLTDFVNNRGLGLGGFNFIDSDGTNDISLFSVTRNGMGIAVPVMLAADPTQPRQAATKEYVDGAVSGATAGGPFLPLGGGTLTGSLTLQADPIPPLGAATKQYVDTRAGAGLPDAPNNATWAYGRKQAAWTTVPQVTMIGGGSWDPGTIDPGNIGLTGLWEVSNQTGATGWPAANVDQCAMILHGFNSNAGWQNQLMMGGRERSGGAAIWYRSQDSGIWMPWRRLLSDAGLFTVLGTTTWNGSPTFNAPVLANSGLSFGSVTDGNADSGALHIQLYSTNYGFGVTNNRLNYFTAAGGGHYFRVSGIDCFSVTQGLITSGYSFVVASNSQTVPATGSGGLQISSNLSNGGGEINLWNLGIGGDPGFDFRRVTASGSTSFRMAYLAANGTFTPAGPVVLPADPTTAMQAATKQYVDAHEGSGGGGIPDAPSDANTYGRHAAAWATVLPTTGGTLTNQLAINAPGGATPLAMSVPTGQNCLAGFLVSGTRQWQVGPLSNGAFVIQDANTPVNNLVCYPGGSSEFDGPVNFVQGLNFGSAVDASPDDFHLHLSMFGSQFGVGITSTRMNYVVPAGSTHYFRSGGADILSIGGTITALMPTAFVATPNMFGVNGGGGTDVILNGGAGTWRNIRQQTNGVDRWTWGCSADPESGGNAGSNLILNCWSDSGTNLHAPLYFIRATGLATVTGNPTDPLGIATKQYVDAAAPPSVKQVPVPFTFAGKPAASALVNVAVAMAMTIAGTLTGSTSFRTTAPAANATFTLNKISSGVTTTLGTVTIVPGSQTPSLAGAGGALAVGDVLQLVAPTTQDATLADVGITILAIRS